MSVSDDLRFAVFVDHLRVAIDGVHVVVIVEVELSDLVVCRRLEEAITGDAGQQFVEQLAAFLRSPGGDVDVGGFDQRCHVDLTRRATHP